MQLGWRASPGHLIAARGRWRRPAPAAPRPQRGCTVAVLRGRARPLTRVWGRCGGGGLDAGLDQIEQIHAAPGNGTCEATCVQRSGRQACLACIPILLQGFGAVPCSVKRATSSALALAGGDMATARPTCRPECEGAAVLAFAAAWVQELAARLPKQAQRARHVSSLPQQVTHGLPTVRRARSQAKGTHHTPATCLAGPQRQHHRRLQHAESSSAPPQRRCNTHRSSVYP